VAEKVTIWYRGASYALGRGQGFYGIWPAGAPQAQPFEWWPETPEGWYGAWARFTGIEAPGTIVPVGQRATRATAGFGVNAGAGPGVAAGSGDGTGSGAITGSGDGTLPAAITGKRTVVAAALLGVGVVCGIAGLFPGYLAGASLAQQSANLVPHGIYLAAWTASAVLILLGGARLRLGALLGAGTSIITFGLFFADLGTAIAGGAHLIGVGLVLGLMGWLACAVGSAVALQLRSGRLWSGRFWSGQVKSGQVKSGGAPGRLGGRTKGSVLTLVLAAAAGLGAAIAFAPSWDSYTLRTAAGASQTVTAGNAFANPAPMIAGDVMVMVALVAVAVVAALWRPARQGGGTAGRGHHPDGGSGDLGASPARAGRLTGAVRDLACPGSAAGAHDQLRSHAGVLDLLRLHRRAGLDVRADAPAGPPGRAGRHAAPLAASRPGAGLLAGRGRIRFRAAVGPRRVRS